MRGHWSLIDRLLALWDRATDNRLLETGMLVQAFQYVRAIGVRGDYFEFGLFRGRLFIHAHRTKVRFGQTGMKLFGFDSFEGLPAVKEARHEVWKAGQFACGEPEFRQILKKARVPENAFELIPGFYCDSLNEALHKRLAGRKAAVVYIDCDLYESTADVLRFLPGYLQDGTIVCFDDFYFYRANPDQGEQRALREFLAREPGIDFLPWYPYGIAGQSFIVRLRSSAGADGNV